MCSRIQVSLDDLPVQLTLSGRTMMNGVFALTNKVKVCDSPEEVPAGDFTEILPLPSVPHEYTDEVGQTGYYAGYVKVTSAGNYYFGIDVDDGGDMVLGGATVSVSGDNAFVHEDNQVYLTPGYHRYVIRYYNELTGMTGLRVYFGTTSDTLLEEEDTYIPYVPHLQGAGLFYPGETLRYQLVLPIPGATHSLVCTSGGLFTVQPVISEANTWDVTYNGSSSFLAEFTAVSMLSAGSSTCSKTADCEGVRMKDNSDNNNGCNCGCNYSSNPSCGSVKFTQTFGQSPWFDGTPSGRLVIHEETPSAKLFTTAAIRYAHPMLRRILNPSEKNPIVRDEYGQIVEYAWEATTGHSAGQDTQIRKVDGAWVEMLEDRTRLYYDNSGSVARLKTPDGVAVTWTELGLEVILDGSGNIRQIYSLADGLLDIVTGSDASHGAFYRIEWYASGALGGKVSGLYTHTGNCIKSFTFRHAANTAGNNEHMELVEARGTTEYTYRWDYISSNGNWSYTRGYGSPEAVTQTKTTVTSNSMFYNTTVITGGSFTPISKTQIIDAGPQGNALLATVINGATMSAAPRVADGTDGAGHVAHDVDSLGLDRSHSYDSCGRNLLTSYVSFGGTATTLEEKAYKAATADDFIDFRPTEERTSVEIDGETWTQYYASHTYDDDYSSGCSVSHYESAGESVAVSSYETYYPVPDATFSSGVRTVPLPYSAGKLCLRRNTDGSMTSHTYSGSAISGTAPSAGAVFVESVTYGYEDGDFSVVPGKSKRDVHYTDIHGNRIKTEHYVCPSGGTSFVFVGSDTFAFDPMRHRTSSLMANGKTTSANWICTGPTMEMDEDGIVTSHFHDALKRKIRTERYSPNGTIVSTFQYDQEDRIIATTVTGGSISLTSGFAYDAEGRITALIAPGGYQTTWTYSQDRLTTTQTNPDGGTIITKTRTDGSPDFVSGTAVVPEFHTSTCRGYTESVVHYGTSDGDAYQLTRRDAFGNTVYALHPVCSGADLEASMIFDSHNRIYNKSESDRYYEEYSYDITGASVCCDSGYWRTHRYRETDTNYVSSGGKVWIVSSETTYTYESDEGESTHLTTMRGALVYPFSGGIEAEEFTVDVRGNTAAVSMTFDPATGKHTAVRSYPGIANRESSVVRDGLLLTSVNILGGSLSNGYDALHRNTSTTDSRGTTLSRYNSIGQVTCVVDPDGGSRTMGYDNMGRVTQLTNALGGTQIRTYDPRGLVLTIRGTAEYPVDFSYNNLGQFVTHVLYRNLASGNGDVTQYEVSPAGLVMAKTDPAGNTVRYEYNAQSLVTSVTRARRNADDDEITIDYQFNEFRELLSKCCRNDSDSDVSIERNAAGQELLRIDAGGTSTMTYNNYRELDSEQNSILGTTVCYLRDSYGRDAGLQVYRGGTMFYNAAYGYDSATGLISSATFNTSATFAFTYVPGTDWEATVSSPVYVKNTTYQTATGRPSEIRYNRPGQSGALLEKQNYAFDMLARITSKTRVAAERTFSPETFAYNNRSEVTSASVDGLNYTYGYDDIGNRTESTERYAPTESYTANACNQYTQSRHDDGDGGYDISQFAHDADGNTTHSKTAWGKFDITYNADDRPIRFVDTDQEFELDCEYDGIGRRILKKTSGYAMRFLYAGTQMIAEFDANPSTGAVGDLRYTEFWDPTNPVATKVLASIDYQMSNTPILRYIMHDAMKNAINAITPDGVLRSGITYTPFGYPIDGNLECELRFAFSSEYYDRELGVHHYLFRDLNYHTGRWLTRDPIGEQGGWNLYAFCRNDGVSKWDRLGCFDIKDTDLSCNQTKKILDYLLTEQLTYINLEKEMIEQMDKINKMQFYRALGDIAFSSCMSARTYIHGIRSLRGLKNSLLTEKFIVNINKYNKLEIISVTEFTIKPELFIS